jgi:CHAT domain-containing protein
VEILALILNENFDLIHYSGHGIFDQQDPANSGWVFGKEPDGKYHTLSAREIFKARRVPRLVFANACFSAVVREGGAATADEMNRELAGMAEAFFERGVQNYIGSGWPVGDTQAVAFAGAFYAKALAGGELGDALADGRRAILGQGSTWGAYHHYGRSNAKLVGGQ